MSSSPRRKHTPLKVVATALGAAAILSLTLCSVFADNIRALFGVSADALGGPSLRVVNLARPGLALEGFKRLRDFSEAPMAMPEAPREVARGDRHIDAGVNAFFDPAQDRFSTFAIDVDTASYSFARRQIRMGRLPVPAAVRVEEFVNAFAYAYPAPRDARPFSVTVDAMPSPFEAGAAGQAGRIFLRVGLQGRKIVRGERKPARLVFLVDVSGSMGSSDKLPLAQEALKILVRNLSPRDEVALVTYAGNTALVLAPTMARDRARIEAGIDSLSSGGGTAMSSGLETAYALAREGLAPQRVSRVIVLSDGDANVGPSSTADLLATIARGATEGVTLTTVGFGQGNYNDAAMEQLADTGNGQSVYIDSLKEARRVFEEQLEGTLEVIAKDVKIQVEFDPAQVARYRLVGYENRDIADRDFRNDARDAGEIGAGHSVTAIYELELKHPGERAGSLGRVRVRAKGPEAGPDDRAREWGFSIGPKALVASAKQASDDLRFAVSVAALAERLRGSAFALSWSMERILELGCDASDGRDERVEHCELARRAVELMQAQS